MITYQITLAGDKNAYGHVSGLREFYSRYGKSWDRTEFRGIHADCFILCYLRLWAIPKVVL